jgi:hypothetical protein
VVIAAAQQRRAGGRAECCSERTGLAEAPIIEQDDKDIGGGVAFPALNTVLWGYCGSGSGNTVRSVVSSTRAGAFSWAETGVRFPAANTNSHASPAD